MQKKSNINEKDENNRIFVEKQIEMLFSEISELDEKISKINKWKEPFEDEVFVKREMISKLRKSLR